MSVLARLASSQGRRDDVPNQELARELAETRDKAAIRELVAHLQDRDRNIQSDCIKTLYEIGYLAPDLISPYAEDFLALLSSRNNRMVWGGMIALATIAALCAPFLFDHRQEIQRAIEKGSVITVDRGIRALATVAVQDDAYRRELIPYLLNHLRVCPPKDLPGRAEGVLVAVDEAHRDAFISVLEGRMPDMRPSQAKRLKKVIAKAGER
jgi:hypothetical protein